MNTLRRLISASGRHIKSGSSRFDRYYVGILETGPGYPTADEARKDLVNYDKSFTVYNWPR